MKLDLPAVIESWLGTPFILGASVKHIGCDCVGLIMGVMGEIGLDVPARDFKDLPSGLKANLPLRSGQIQYGDILLFSSPFYVNQFHAGFYCPRNFLIHAHWSKGVVKNTFGNFFMRRHIGTYFFTDI